jgi:histidinol-phosphate aminotransferase
VKRSNPLTGVKKRVVDVPAYTLRAYEAEIKLNQNESPYDFPEDLKEEVVRIYREKKWSRYPDFVPDSLRASLARFAGWKKEGILVGNGSNELLQATLMVFVREHTPVAIPSPTFTVYGLVSTILGATILHIPLNPDMSFNVDELIARSNEAQARVLVICTPNNPTGTVLSEDEARRILDNFSGHVLLDEAYFEFCGRTSLKLLEQYPRLIITRTFSKAMGMAGLRVGYLMAHPDLVVQIDKAKLPYNINQFSLTAAQVALDHVDRFQPAIQAIISERERLGKDLAEMPGVRVYPSGANFFLFEVPTSPGLLFEELYQQGILIRNVSRYPMLSKCLRVAVGTPEENSRFLTALRQALAKAETGATSNC